MFHIREKVDGKVCPVSRLAFIVWKGNGREGEEEAEAGCASQPSLLRRGGATPRASTLVALFVFPDLKVISMTLAKNAS